MELTQEQADILNEIADHQLRGESFEHAYAATLEHWKDERHREDGGDDASNDSICTMFI